MNYSKKLWLWLGGIFILSFAVLGLIGREIYVHAPPVPAKVVSTSAETIYTRADIQTGREVWQTLGGMQLGSIWGHGGYVAPDWGTDWLHREATTMLNIWARRDGAKNFASLDPETQAALKERLKRDLRINSFDAASDTITVSKVRAEAMAEVGDHYIALFSSDPALQALRVQYAIPERSIVDPGQREQLAAFFFNSSLNNRIQSIIGIATIIILGSIAEPYNGGFAKIIGVQSVSETKQPLVLSILF